jgi:hypothetical protein
MPIGIRQISRLRKALWLWIIVGAAIVAHAVLFSGGVVEPFLLWQLERYQAVDEGSTMLALLAVVVGLPALILTLVIPGSRIQAVPFDARRKRQGLIGSGLCILVLAALGTAALFSVLSRPSAADPTLAVALDTLKGAPSEGRATVTGAPRPDYIVNYYQDSFGWKSGSTSRVQRTLLPVTSADWTLGRPITVIMDTRGRDWHELMTPSTNGEWTSRSGYLLPGQLTGYERRAIEDRGVSVADAVMLYSTDRLSGTTGLTVFAIICGCAGVPLLAGFVATALMKPQV